MRNCLKEFDAAVERWEARFEATLAELYAKGGMDRAMVAEEVADCISRFAECKRAFREIRNKLAADDIEGVKQLTEQLILKGMSTDNPQ
jgi:hypothetical protein